jgi:hypothetical protein
MQVPETGGLRNTVSQGRDVTGRNGQRRRITDNVVGTADDPVIGRLKAIHRSRSAAGRTSPVEKARQVITSTVPSALETRSKEGTRSPHLY